MTTRAGRFGLVGFAVALLSLFANGRVHADGDATFKWVIISSASALAADGSTITLTGSGKFNPNEPDEVNGGGTWTVSSGGSGVFTVKGLIRFDPAPGHFPEPPDPSIHAGLAFFRIAYSDNSRGILAVSCSLIGTPANVAEGITASKGFVYYFNLQSSGTFFQQVSGEE